MAYGILRLITGHLAELRKRLIILVLATTVGMGIAWNFSPSLLSFVEKPLSGKSYLSDIKQNVYQKVKEHYPAFYTSHRLGNDLESSTRKRQLNYTSPLEPFFIQCKISLVAGFILILPIAFYQLWRFISPRLQIRGKRVVMPFVAMSSISFCAGAIFFLVFVWPVIINFSLSYEAQGLQSWFNLSSYINFCLRLVLVFGLIFELPMLSLILARLGVLSHGLLSRNRKYAVLASAVIAAFHADLVTMFIIMAPLYLMYEISIWMVLFFGKRTAPTVAAC